MDAVDTLSNNIKNAMLVEGIKGMILGYEETILFCQSQIKFHKKQIAELSKNTGILEGEGDEAN